MATIVKTINFNGKILDFCRASEFGAHRAFNKFASLNGLIKEGKDQGGDVDRVSEVNPECLYIRVRAVTANTPNNNGDLFTRDELKRTYKTFIGKNVFKNHKSDDVTNTLGKIIDAIWVENPSDADHPYVECLLEVDRMKDKDLVRSVEMGHITDVSMGCRVEFSVCSCCDNRAHTEDQYCECVKNHKGQKYCPVHKKNNSPDGIYESNFGVEFFELSFVTDGADKDAVIKEILASGATSGTMVEKLSKVGQILVDSPNTMFQECGLFLRCVASKEVVSSDDMEKATKIIDLIESFIA